MDFPTRPHPGYIGLRVLDAYKGENPEDPAATDSVHSTQTDYDFHGSFNGCGDVRFNQRIPGVEPLPANYDDQRFIQSYGPVESLCPWVNHSTSSSR